MINNKTIVFDIETTTQTEMVLDLPESILRQFKSLYDKSLKLKWDNLQDAYQNEGPFHPEFSKVLCISVGFLKDNNEFKISNFNIKDNDDERMVLIKFRELLDKCYGMDYHICGNNIKGFDIPFLGKRYLINKLSPPKHFPRYDTKPWDLKIIDFKDIWTFGKFGGLFNTDLICSTMGIESPKGEMDGSKVYSKYYDNKIDDIIFYCNKDVEALLNLIKEFDEFE